MDIETVGTDRIMETNDQMLNLIDLCDLVLIKICSHLDLYDKCIVIPQVCSRFQTISSLCSPKEISTNEFHASDKWNEKKISMLLRKIGTSLRTFKNYRCLSKPNSWSNHLDSMLIEIREKCFNIDSLHIQSNVNVGHLKELPTSIRKLQMKTFQGDSLDLRHLRLEILHVTMDSIPSSSDWIKVTNRFKEVKFSLNAETIPFKITLNGLLSLISDEHSLYIKLWSGFSDDGPYIHLDPLNSLTNIKEFSLIGYETDSYDMNKMLQSLAERCPIETITISCVTRIEDAPSITSTTINSLRRCATLKSIYFFDSCWIHSLMCGYIEKLHLQNIQMRYGYLAVNDGQTMELSIEQLIHINKFFDFFIMYASLQYFPLERTIEMLLGFEDKNVWILFNTLLEDNPRVQWQTRDRFQIIITART